MTSQLITKLPHYVVNIIKLYTGEGCWRNNKYIHIHRIPKNDPRYEMLKNRPKIKQVRNDQKDHPLKGSAWFKMETGKFVVINVREGYYFNGNFNIYGHFWEMHFKGEIITMYIY